MGLFTKTEETSVSNFKNILSTAFEHVKRDTSHIFEWLKYFYSKHQEHDERLAKIEQQMTYMPKSHQEIKQIIDTHYSYDHILSKIEQINSRLAAVEQAKYEPKTSLKEKLVRKITKNSKEYVKSVIISLIRKYGSISAPQLKEIVVEEQGLCSKSSFYRLLTELEQNSEVSELQKGKEKVYFHKTAVIK